MRFISTRNKIKSASLTEAILYGLASDGGLFVPEFWPSLTIEEDWHQLSFSELAYKTLIPFFQDDPLNLSLEKICNKAFNFPVILKDLPNNTAVLELFHGPTSAFKDFGAQFLALCLKSILNKSSRQPMVLVATSGDTGGAVASAFSEYTNIPVTILYPKGMISRRQEMQLTSWGQQVHAFAVRGSFDHCQKIVKEAFVSEWWQKNFQLISANSINLGRLFPQMAYYAYASLQFQHLHKKTPGFIIPSGNLGNSVAALWAKKMGFPIRKIIFAHNMNKSVPNYFSSGSWTPLPTVPTLANAMDVGDPSNMERVKHLLPDLTELKKFVSAQAVSDEEIQECIRHGEKTWGQIWCPHTATAVFIREQMLQKIEISEASSDIPWIIVATAHPAKFETIVEPLIGKKILLPKSLEKILHLPCSSTEINPTLEDLRLNLS